MHKIIQLLKSPLLLGLAVTALLSFFAFEYYRFKNSNQISSENSVLFDLMTWVDHKSADLRMNLRGPESAKNSPVAILAIDDQSLEEIGRWPWSRSQTAHLIDETIKHGAKVIAFDMVFSEPERTPGADEAFAKVIRKHRSQLVMGAYSDPLEEPLRPFQEVCYHRLFQQTPYFSIHENEERPLVVVDPDAQSDRLSATFADILDPVFVSIGEAKREAFIAENLSHKSPDQWTSQDRVRLKRAEDRAMLNYCARWLSGESDEAYELYKEYWAAFLEGEYPQFVKADFKDSVTSFSESAQRSVIKQTGKWWVNTPILKEPAAHTAFFNADLDSDGSIRNKPLIYRAGGHYIPSLALQAFLVATDSQAQVFIKNQKDIYNRTYKVIEQFQIANLEGEAKFDVPVNARGNLRINYKGPQKMFPYLRASDLFSNSDEATITYRRFNKERSQYEEIEEKVKKADFIKDKVFVLGATAVGVYDLRVTPFDENYPGVETHANIISNLIEQSFLQGYPEEERYMLATMIGLGITISVVVTYLGAFWGMLISFLAFAGIFLIDYQFIYAKGTVVSIAFPMFLVIALYMSLTFFKYFTEERNKKHLRSTFSKYVSPAIVDEILKDPTNIELGGKKQRITVFFSDVRGFTSISEKLDPVMLSKLLSDYLTPMTEIVFQNKGTLDKYMGDAIMAFFGAPIQYDDHAAHACRCALQSLEKLKELQKQFKAQNLPLIDIGIGLNSAEMSVGNMGSNIVRNYTVMGDAVNLGSRLEGINKQYGTRIIISEFTYQDIKDDFTARELDWVRVKGKNEPIRIYELICEGKAQGTKAQVLKHFEEGFKLYHAQEFASARTEFEQALKLDPEDRPSALYVERCDNYLQLPPAAGWDGVFVMTSK